jgi:hypothetical protein
MARKNAGAEQEAAEALMTAWSDELERAGSLEFSWSRAKIAGTVAIGLGFVAIGAVMALAAHGFDQTVGVLAGVMGGVVVAFSVLQTSASPPVLADRDGVRLIPRAPLRVAWPDLLQASCLKMNRLAPEQLVLDLEAGALDDYRAAAPPWWRLALGVTKRDQLRVSWLSVPVPVLADWLERQANHFTPVPDQLVLYSAAQVSPVWGATTLRPVELSRLPLSWELSGDLADWGRRAAAADQVDPGGRPAPEWPDLVVEGRALVARLERELGDGTTVGWFEDGPAAASDA